ncbi:relaxasome subunit MobC [Mediterraneibacter gnavus]|uniref:relaxasome subunit MobC n=1 Tax=Mediterraneibacter gnavus TaxID=33038 RepID=UPI0011847956|nr:relaxasome subunit MobC [Mediterraneibacter gnavus]
MPRSKKSNEERIAELLAKKQSAEESAKKFEAQLKTLQKKDAEEKRKKRNHLLIQLGAVVEKTLEREIEEADIERLARFISKQELNGKFFTKAMQKEESAEN